MSLVRIIDKETVLKTLKMDEVIQVVENCYVQKASGMGKSVDLGGRRIIKK